MRGGRTAAGKPAEFSFPPDQGRHGLKIVGTQFEVLNAVLPRGSRPPGDWDSFIQRAIAYLEGKGFRMRPDTRNEKEGKLLSADLEEEIGASLSTCS